MYQPAYSEKETKELEPWCAPKIVVLELSETLDGYSGTDDGFSGYSS